MIKTTYFALFLKFFSKKFFHLYKYFHFWFKKVNLQEKFFLKYFSAFFGKNVS